MNNNQNTPNVENMRTWVARLRDPNAKQTRFALRSRDAMCCLGHACDASGLGEWMGEWDKDQTYLQEKLALPLGVADWLGVTVDPELVDVHDRATTKRASAINDSGGEGYSLAQIADCVEATWPEVVVAK